MRTLLALAIVSMFVPSLRAIDPVPLDIQAFIAASRKATAVGDKRATLELPSVEQIVELAADGSPTVNAPFDLATGSDSASSDRSHRS